MPKPGYMRMFFYGIYRRGDDVSTTWDYIGPDSVADHAIFQEAYRGQPHGIAYVRPLPGHKVNGDVYDVPVNEILHRIDQVEGHPTWYKRTNAVTEGGHEVQIYILQEPVEDHPGYMENGPDWSEWVSRYGSENEAHI